jgi:hypothetical protein
MLSEIRMSDRTLKAVDQTTVVFKKAGLWLPMGNKIEDVALLVTNEALLFCTEVHPLFASQIPWSQIQNLSYERKRVTPGGAAGLRKRHWLVLEWVAHQHPQWVHIRLDGGNFEEILETISLRSGGRVEGWIGSESSQ